MGTFRLPETLSWHLGMLGDFWSVLNPNSLILIYRSIGHIQFVNSIVYSLYHQVITPYYNYSQDSSKLSYKSTNALRIQKSGNKDYTKKNWSICFKQWKISMKSYIFLEVRVINMLLSTYHKSITIKTRLKKMNKIEIWLRI